MTDSLLVLAEDAVAGTLHRLVGGRLRFDYADEYRAKPEATPLSLSMPLAVRSHTERTVTPWLWGLLPDNDAVLARWVRHFQVSRATPFSLLATPIGEDCAGAVRFVDPEMASPSTRAGAVTWLSEDEVTQRLKDLREDSTSWLGRSFTGQFSLAGTQAKTALLFESGRWGVPSGNRATTHIVKPAVAGLDDHDLNEHLCLDAAGRAGWSRCERSSTSSRASPPSSSSAMTGACWETRSSGSIRRTSAKRSPTHRHSSIRTRVGQPLATW